MKIVLPGGTGQLGTLLTRFFQARGDEVVVLSRGGRSLARLVPWDARTGGAWVNELDGADAVVNLAGRSVNCRYTRKNLAEMLSSRVDSTRAIGAAIERVARPPRVWLQMSTATLYAHRFDAANDEATGLLGGDEAGVPAYWKRSVELAQAWEAAQAEARTPATRKVLLRAAMVMSEDRGGVFDVLSGLAQKGLGGPVAGGRQYVSWLHRRDLERALALLIERQDLAGPFNLSSPRPLPQGDFMAGLRAALGVGVGLPATAWMASLGAWVLRTDPELVLKSRRVTPGRLLEAGFTFDYPEWPAAAQDLVKRAQHRW
jgi:uncharacterized protein (TIGR01777 family)